MRITSGNVGIGTTAPEAYLHVKKDENTQTQIILDNPNTGTSHAVELLLKDSTNSLYIGSSYNYTNPDFRGSYMTHNGVGPLHIKNNVSGEPIYFYTSGADDAHIRQTIDGTGNVGIGTTAPVAPLQVQKDQDTVTTVELVNTSAGTSSESGYFLKNGTHLAGFGLLGVNHSGYGTQVADIGNIYTNAAAGFNIMVDNATGYINFTTGGPSNERMRINNDGNVGIGTSAPAALVDIGGGTRSFIDGVNDLLVKDSVEIDGNLYVTKSTTFANEISNTCADGGSVTINWANGNKQKLMLTDNSCTVSFVAPVGVGNYTLKVVQGASGSDTITWPAGMKWPAATAPTLTVTASAVDIITFYHDGTTYFGVGSLDFR
jgi:hypothetical protein